LGLTSTPAPISVGLAASRTDGGQDFQEFLISGLGVFCHLQTQQQTVIRCADIGSSLPDKMATLRPLGKGSR